jgi:hypothetical protein
MLAWSKTRGRDSMPPLHPLVFGGMETSTGVVIGSSMPAGGTSPIESSPSRGRRSPSIDARRKYGSRPHDWSGSSYLGPPRRSFIKSTNARTFGESPRLLANTIFTSTGAIDQSGKSRTSWPESQRRSTAVGGDDADRGRIAPSGDRLSDRRYDRETCRSGSSLSC